MRVLLSKRLCRRSRSCSSPLYQDNWAALWGLECWNYSICGTSAPSCYFLSTDPSSLVTTPVIAACYHNLASLVMFLLSQQLLLIRRSRRPRAVLDQGKQTDRSSYRFALITSETTPPVSIKFDTGSCQANVISVRIEQITFEFYVKIKSGFLTKIHCSSHVVFT
jgi:hypothetical protein